VISLHISNCRSGQLQRCPTQCTVVSIQHCQQHLTRTYQYTDLCVRVHSIGRCCEGDCIHNKSRRYLSAQIHINGCGSVDSYVVDGRCGIVYASTTYNWNKASRSANPTMCTVCKAHRARVRIESDSFSGLDIESQLSPASR